MALQLHRWWIATLSIILLTAIITSHARRLKRPLLRANARARVPDAYFVHLRDRVKLEKVQELVGELHRRSSEGGNFKAEVLSIITRAGYGFSAKLSRAALNYVSKNAIIFSILILHLIENILK